MRTDTASLVQHYVDILRANGLAKRSIDNYTYSLKGFVRFLEERPLESATPEDIIAYQIQIASQGGSDSSIRVATYALRYVSSRLRHGAVDITERRSRSWCPPSCWVG